MVSEDITHTHTHTHTHIYIYIFICIYIYGKLGKPNIQRRFSCNISFLFKEELLLTGDGWLVGWLVEFLWYINPCILFNAKFCHYIYIYIYTHVQPKISKRILM